MRSVDDIADIHGKGRRALDQTFASQAQPAPKATTVAPAVPAKEATAGGHKFCRYMDGSEGAVVRGLHLNKI